VGAHQVFVGRDPPLERFTEDRQHSTFVTPPTRGRDGCGCAIDIAHSLSAHHVQLRVRSSYDDKTM
jgi:hypothetical protein